MMSKHEVARWLGVDPRTVPVWIKTYGLPAVKVSGRWRFDPVKVAEWLESQKVYA